MNSFVSLVRSRRATCSATPCIHLYYADTVSRPSNPIFLAARADCSRSRSIPAHPPPFPSQFSSFIQPRLRDILRNRRDLAARDAPGHRETGHPRRSRERRSPSPVLQIPAARSTPRPRKIVTVSVPDNTPGTTLVADYRLGLIGTLCSRLLDCVLMLAGLCFS